MLHVGTSGWQYRDWRGAFYPDGLAQRDWLHHYAERFATVELNSSFYRLPQRAAFERWAEQTPAGFLMAVKMSRYLTHILRLRDPEEPIRRFLDRARGLGAKLGPVLLQLPPQLQADPERLARTLDSFPNDFRVAVEPRHESWFDEPVRAILERRNAALCLADPPQRRLMGWRTAGWGFVRFHQGQAQPLPCYDRHTLTSWAELIAAIWPASAEVFCYFNNDTHACAVRDAVAFAGLAREAGLSATAVPQPAEVRLAS